MRIHITDKSEYFFLIRPTSHNKAKMTNMQFILQTFDASVLGYHILCIHTDIEYKEKITKIQKTR